MYLAMDKVAKGAFEAEIGWPDNTRDLQTLSKSLSGKIDLERVEPDRFNAKLEPSPL